MEIEGGVKLFGTIQHIKGGAVPRNPIRVVIAILALTTGACSVLRPGVAKCEEYLSAKLRSPSTYKQVAVESVKSDTELMVW